MSSLLSPLQNGTLLTIGIVAAVAAVGAANKAGLYGSRSKVEVPRDAVFYATTKGGKYQIVITPAGVYYGVHDDAGATGVQAYDLREYTRGNVSGMGTYSTGGLRDHVPRMLHDSARIDGVHFLVKKDTLGLMGEARRPRRARRHAPVVAKDHRAEVPRDAVFYATTKGGKYQIVITPAGVYYGGFTGVQAYDLREYTRGNVSGMGTYSTGGLRDHVPRMLHDSARIDGVHFLVKKDTLGLMGEARGSRATGSTRLRPLEHRSVKATAAESAGMVNPPVVIEVFVPNPNAKGRGKFTKAFRLVTAAGTSDDLDVFRYGDYLLVVIKNSRLPYVGATLFTRDAPEPWRVDQDVFFQGSEEAEEALGKRWESWSELTLASHLLDVMN